MLDVTNNHKRKRLTYLLLIQGCLSILLLIATLRSARAGFDISVVGSGTLSDIRTPGTTAYSGKFGIGAGLIFGIPIGQSSQIELGGVVANRKFEYSYTLLGTNYTNVLTLNILEIPLMYRHWFAKWVGLGFGGYYGKYVGAATSDTTNNRTGKTTTSKSNYGRNGFRDRDAGVVASVAFRIPTSQKVSVLVDARYTYGLLNNTYTGDAVRFSDVQALAGLVFSL